MKLSTGLRDYMMATGSFKAGMDGSYVKIYSGTAPASPDDAIPSGSTLLTTVSVGGTATGVTFEATATAGLLVKAAGETWEGTNLADGTATWFRLAPTADAGAASATALRVQGSVGQAGADLNITNTSLTTNAVQSVDYFSILKPE